MTEVPSLPLDTSTRNLIRFMKEFRTVGGYMAVFSSLKKQQALTPGNAYLKTESLYFELFEEQRYKDRESFYNARNHYKRRQKRKETP